MDIEIRRSVEAFYAFFVLIFRNIVDKLFRDPIWRPYAFHKAYTNQGIRGPPYLPDTDR